MMVERTGPTNIRNEEVFKTYQVDIEKCSACESCVNVCPTEAISIVDGHAVIDIEECIECGAWAAECPEEAIIEVD